MSDKEKIMEKGSSYVMKFIIVWISFGAAMLD
jgi:hypothetical protein